VETKKLRQEKAAAQKAAEARAAPPPVPISGLTPPGPIAGNALPAYATVDGDPWGRKSAAEAPTAGGSTAASSPITPLTKLLEAAAHNAPMHGQSEPVVNIGSTPSPAVFEDDRSRFVATERAAEAVQQAEVDEGLHEQIMDDDQPNPYYEPNDM